MEPQKLTELPNEELLKKSKTTKLVAGMLIGVLIALTTLNLFNIFNGKQHWGVLAVPLALMPIVFITYNSVREINKELRSRGLL
ncbi:redox-active disulfide protein 2 [Emticicia oligotrophica]|uniref:redox-active disulfide protein 2 n=1 Tax=Emticicia oligotrophica TaxID=312279 RepID=UPI00273B8071|nr:redox-active disulfide protein 2 [Emticicia oligotrophica]